VIPEIDIWRIANLMLKHYGDNAQAEGTRRVDQLAEDGDHAGVAIWMRIIDAIGELVEHDCSRTCTLTERPLRSARPGIA